MAHHSFLCSSDAETLYPSYARSDYDPKVGTVAYAEQCVPLLWLALFRPENMYRQTFDVKGEEIEAVGPLVRKSTALRHLQQAVPALNELFADEGPLDAHAECLRQALESSPGRVVTIEMDEIAMMYEDEEQFYLAFAAALSYPVRASAGDEREHNYGEDLPPEEWRKLFSHICELRLPGTFYTPRELLACEQPEEDDVWNLVAILGMELYRQTPWYV